MTGSDVGVHRAAQPGRRRGARQLVRLLPEVAAAVPPAAEVVERRLLGAADVLRHGRSGRRTRTPAGRRRAAAGSRGSCRAARGPCARRRAAGTAAGPTAYGWRGSSKTCWTGPSSTSRAGVEHADAVAHLRDDVEVVADEQDRRAELGAQRRDEVEHLGLDRRVEAGRRLVEDQQGRVLRQRHGDHDALLHAARELVRVAAHDPRRVGDLDLAQHLLRALLGLALGDPGDRERLGDLVADADRRVQRPAGVLVDHRHARRAHPPHVALAHGEQVLAGDLDRARAHPAVARQVADDREGRGRLAAAGLADEAVGLALGDLERDAAQHRAPDAAHAVGDLEVGELERGRRATAVGAVIARTPGSGRRR